MVKIYDGEFQVFDVNGLNVLVFSSKEKDCVEVYVNYPEYSHLMSVFGIPYEEFDVEDILRHVNIDFVRYMKDYFSEVEKLEECYS